MDLVDRRPSFTGVAARFTIFAHTSGLVAFALLIIWLLHFRGGINYDSTNFEQVFNVHPFLMFCGFILLVGEAMMAYKTVPATHNAQKTIHSILHFTALILGLVGICAAFKFHDIVGSRNLYSLHSWIGIVTFCIFTVQWLVGILTFWIGGRETRIRTLPWHRLSGRILLHMAVCSALTGLMHRSIYPQAKGIHETRIINFTALFILLFGIFVDLSVSVVQHGD